MRKWNVVFLLIAMGLIVMGTVSAHGADKLKGSTTLKDLQPAGTTDSKDHKNQQFDFTFVAAPNEYVCRTDPKTKISATDYVVGSAISYEIDKNKVKLKNTAGKETKCTVVRVEVARAGQ